jgi:hypothetical protein
VFAIDHREMRRSIDAKELKSTRASQGRRVANEQMDQSECREGMIYVGLGSQRSLRRCDGQRHWERVSHDDRKANQEICGESDMVQRGEWRGPY